MKKDEIIRDENTINMSNVMILAREKLQTHGIEGVANFLQGQVQCIKNLILVQKILDDEIFETRDFITQFFKATPTALNNKCKFFRLFNYNE